MDFDCIYKSYYLDVYHFLCGLSSNKEIAEDITQETFCRALYKKTEFIDHLINKEQVEKIQNFLKNMKDPYKIVFELRIHGELSFEKIGKIFGKSSGWARVTYYRAKMKILEYMEAENNE